MAVDFLSDLPSAMEGALEGGDPTANGSIAEEDLRSGGSYDIPTGAPPSPLFGARPFEQKMILFEEFGTRPLEGAPAGTVPFPQPTTGPAPEQDPNDVYSSGPSGLALEGFLADPGLLYSPSEYSNTADSNPWEVVVEGFLGRDLQAPPAEGRPPGKGWAHQRWNEFYPEVYLKTAMAGSRVNGGFRDASQRHGYALGEFGPDGLYHEVYTSAVAGAPSVLGTTEGVGIRIHPRMPVQDHKSIWTFDGTLPPKLLVARAGEGVLVRNYNALPIDPSANRGFGLHTISTHMHNGHNPAESDGYANAFFFPGQFYDYRWPLQLAGYDTINTTAEDPRAAMPCEPGETIFVNDLEPGYKTCDANGRINLRGDYRETQSTLWFHDHMLDFTAQNVYKGNAAMMNTYSALDRGNEAWDDGVNLRFPSGDALSWGNRDYDVNLVIGDKAWDSSGQLWFNIFNKDGFLGDQLLTNWLYKPYFDVRARSYRFRMLNGSVSRYLAVALVQEVRGSGGEIPGPRGSGVSYNRVGFHMIANDGNIMQHAIPFTGELDLDGDGDADEHKGLLPTQAIAERYDIVVDFASQGIRPGDRLYFVNLMEHKDGAKPSARIALRDVLSGRYQARARRGRWEGGDPVVGPFLEFRVQEYDGVDLSMDPTEYEPGGLSMTEMPFDREDPALQDARHRTFDFAKSGGTDGQPWTIKTDGGQGLVADPRRLSAAPQLATGPTEAGFDGSGASGLDEFGTMEIWEMDGNGGWSHPIHVHFEEGLILTRDGRLPPLWEMWARKDIFRLGPEPDSSQKVEVVFRFREFAGTYVEHCHNTQHEDHAMLLRWDLEHPGQVEMMPAPIPTWDGVEYVDSHALPTFRSGDGFGPTD
jgi:manganese oxidase